MLGMGGATTPAAINAMASMCREEGKATDNMLMLLVINATSIQIIPATAIATSSKTLTAVVENPINPSALPRGRISYPIILSPSADGKNFVPINHLP